MRYCTWGQPQVGAHRGWKGAPTYPCTRVHIRDISQILVIDYLMYLTVLLDAIESALAGGRHPSHISCRPSRFGMYRSLSRAFLMLTRSRKLVLLIVLSSRHRLHQFDR